MTFQEWFNSAPHRAKYSNDHPAYLAAQEAWSAANDAAQHRINRLNAEIEAWKVRFKIAEDALAKLNGQEQKPVAWTSWRELAGARHYVTSGWVMHAHKRSDEDIPLYTSPQPTQPSKPLTDEQIMEMYNEPRSDAEMLQFARAIERAHGIKGGA